MARHRLLPGNRRARKCSQQEIDSLTHLFSGRGCVRVMEGANHRERAKQKNTPLWTAREVTLGSEAPTASGQPAQNAGRGRSNSSTSAKVGTFRSCCTKKVGWSQCVAQCSQRQPLRLTSQGSINKPRRRSRRWDLEDAELRLQPRGSKEGRRMMTVYKHTKISLLPASLASRAIRPTLGEGAQRSQRPQPALNAASPVTINTGGGQSRS